MNWSRGHVPPSFVATAPEGLIETSPGEIYVPDNVVTNHDLAKLMDTSDEWIQSRTGIRQRHIANQQVQDDVQHLDDSAHH